MEILLRMALLQMHDAVCIHEFELEEHIEYCIEGSASYGKRSSYLRSQKTRATWQWY